MMVLQTQQRSDLQVPVDHILLGVEVVQRRHDLRPVEAGPLLREHAVSRQVEEQLSSVGVLHDETQAVRSLEGILKTLLRGEEKQEKMCQIDS